MRHLVRDLFISGLIVLAVILPARGQDRVHYRDRASGKELDAGGTIQTESADRIIIKGTTAKEVSAADVLDVNYEVPAGAIRLDYGRLVTLERKVETLAKEEERVKGWNELLKSYQDLMPKLSGDKMRFARRHLQYRMALVQTRLADDDPPQAAGALAALEAFKKEHPDSWQITAAARLLGRLQVSKGDAGGALKTYQDVAAIASLSNETKQEFEVLGAQALIAGKKYAEAKQKLEALQKRLTADDPRAIRVQVHLAECLAGSGELAKAVPQLEALIGKTTDPALKAVAYNALGDCYRLNGRAKDALWAYLYVDVLYYRDKQEHAKAVAQLAKLFEELGDSTRAAQYKEKLRKDIK